MEPIQVFVLTHNRPEFILKTINSILSQTYKNIELIVSDNSTNNLTYELLSKIRNNNLTYIKRSTHYGPIDHLNCILKEVKTDFFMIFHDDDIMFPNMVETLYNNLIDKPHIVAAGINAYFILDGKLTKKQMLKRSYGDVLINNNIELAQRYLIRNGIVPFPSYMYRKEIANKIEFNYSNGGEFSDMTFLMEAANIGTLLLINKPSMYYFVHPENDHVPDFYKNISKIINFILNTSDLTNKSELIYKFRLRALYMELKQGILSGRIKIFSNRYLLILQIIIKKSFFDYFPRVLIISLMKAFKISTSTMKS